jgi:RimJ/RimL family protein N-acetyltransferase
MTSDVSEAASITVANVILRPVEPADEPFLLELYAATRTEEMALVPWSEAQKKSFIEQQFNAQQEHYKKNYPDASHDVIICDRRNVGRIYVARLPTAIRIVDITIAAAERNRGIGTGLIRRLMQESERTSKPLTIYVEAFNPSVRLFQRLGFLPGEEQGIHVLMEWSSRSKD